MKAIRIRQCKDVHPEYNPAKNRAKLAAGETPSPKFITRDVGEIVEDPNVVDLCLGDDPVFAPHDEECRQAVLKKLDNPKRVGTLNQLKSMYASREKLSPEARARVEALFERRASEIAGNSPAQRAGRNVPTPTAE